MLDKFKHMNELRKLQDEVKRETVTIERDGIRVVMRGDFEVVELSLNPDVDAKSQEGTALALLKEAKKDIQKKLAESLRGLL